MPGPWVFQLSERLVKELGAGKVQVSGHVTGECRFCMSVEWSGVYMAHGLCVG